MHSSSRLSSFFIFLIKLCAVAVIVGSFSTYYIRDGSPFARFFKRDNDAGNVGAAGLEKAQARDAGNAKGCKTTSWSPPSPSCATNTDTSTGPATSSTAITSVPPTTSSTEASSSTTSPSTTSSITSSSSTPITTSSITTSSTTTSATTASSKTSSSSSRASSSSTASPVPSKCPKIKEKCDKVGDMQCAGHGYFECFQVKGKYHEYAYQYRKCAGSLVCNQDLLNDPVAQNPCAYYGAVDGDLGDSPECEPDDNAFNGQDPDPQ